MRCGRHRVGRLQEPPGGEERVRTAGGRQSRRPPALDSWWWPTRPIQVPGARTAGLLAGLGAVLFGVSALLVKIGAVGWDLSLFRILNQVPAAAASVLTPLSHLFLPAGIVHARRRT